jgi:hypothetical protein
MCSPTSHECIIRVLGVVLSHALLTNIELRHRITGLLVEP